MAITDIRGDAINSFHQIFGGNVSIEPRPGILADEIRTLGADIRSFRVPFERSIKEVLIPSFRTNFDVEGRPKWAPLTRATMRWRKYKGKPILEQTGLLKRTFATTQRWRKVWTIRPEEAFIDFGNLPTDTNRLSGASLRYYAQALERGSTGSVGTQAEREAVSQLGATYGVDGGELPARPYLIIQDEDEDKIRDIFQEYVADRVRASYRYGHRRVSRATIVG